MRAVVEGIVSERKYDEYTVLDIEREKASWHGYKLAEHGGFIKRKFENHLIISRPKERLKIQYV